MSEIDYLKQDVTSLNKQLDQAYQVLINSLYLLLIKRLLSSVRIYIRFIGRGVKVNDVGAGSVVKYWR